MPTSQTLATGLSMKSMVPRFHAQIQQPLRPKGRRCENAFPSFAADCIETCGSTLGQCTIRVNKGIA